jgi:hypothetical protein
MFNPLRNVDDTYYSSNDPNTGQPIISNIHMAKVAIRLYINLYTTNDGRPPSNIQLNFVRTLVSFFSLHAYVDVYRIFVLIFDQVQVMKEDM